MTRERRPLIDVAAGIPICGITGVNGAGKTTLAVESALVAMRAGRTVYSTVQITSPWGDSRPITGLRELLELRDAVLLFDEVATLFSSRSSQSLPPEFDVLLQTLRHKGLSVIWTAPAWMRADNRLREVTQALVSVSPLLRRHDGTLWPRPRLLMVGTLDTSEGAVDSAPTRVLRRRFVVPSRLAAWGTFDTHADAPTLGRRVGGKCPDCGGSRPLPKCDASRHSELGLPWLPAAL